MRHALLPLVAVLTLLFPVPAMGAVQPQRLAWDELHQLIGKQVSIPLYDGCAVSGKVLEVEPDALLIQVSKTSHPQSHPKGHLRVPRATLHVLDIHGKGFKHRVVGTAIGVVAGIGSGLGVALAVQGGLFSIEHGTAAPAAFVAVMSGVTATGYLLGNAADRTTTTVRIIP